MTKDIQEKAGELAEAIQGSDSIAHLGHWQTARDSLPEDDALTDNTWDNGEMSDAIARGIGRAGPPGVQRPDRQQHRGETGAVTAP